MRGVVKCWGCRTSGVLALHAFNVGSRSYFVRTLDDNDLCRTPESRRESDGNVHEGERYKKMQEVESSCSMKKKMPCTPIWCILFHSTTASISIQSEICT